MIQVKDVSSPSELDIAFEIRKKVFVEEQNVPIAEEYDEFEVTANHILAFYNDKPVGTARVRLTEKGSKLERFSVLREYRMLGVGSELVKNLLTKCRNRIESYVYLYSQVQACDFYGKFGFVERGDFFLDAGIEHLEMYLKAPDNPN